MSKTNGLGSKKAVLHARISTDEQARPGYYLAQQIGADLYRPTPGLSLHRRDRRVAPKRRWLLRRIELIRTGSKNAAMLSQFLQEVLFPLPKNGVFVGMACEEAAPGYTRSLHLSTNDRNL